MKKILLLTVFIFVGYSSLKAQRIYQSFESRYVFPSVTPDNRTTGFAMSYATYFNVSKDFRGLKVGPSIGIYYMFGGENQFDSGAFFGNLGGAFDFTISKEEKISIGSHLGYTLITPSEFDGGLYYRPYLRWGIVMASYGNMDLKQGEYTTFQLGFIIGIDSY